jgi:hypothetical protein
MKPRLDLIGTILLAAVVWFIVFFLQAIGVGGKRRRRR